MSCKCFIVPSHREAKEPGAMWETKTDKGESNWFVILPNGVPHNIHSKSSDGTPWDVTGEAPNFTVNPSINWLEIKKDDGTVYKKGWHGWLQNGVLTDDVEGRTYNK